MHMEGTRPMITIMICPKCRCNNLRLMENRVSQDDYLICDHYPYCSYVMDLDPWIPRDLILQTPPAWSASA